MHPAFGPEPFKFKNFLIGFAINLLTAAVLLTVSLRFPQQRGYFYATVAGLLAIGVAWAVVSYRKRNPPSA